ncbi:MAG: ANTAR domain-containing protein [Pseudomonadota bacterium]
MIEPLRILIIDDDYERSQYVSQSLAAAGFDPTTAKITSHRLLQEISNANPDVILVDMDSPNRDVLESLSLVSAHNPTPIVMYAREQDPEAIAQAVAAGVSTYLVGSVDAERVRPVIEVARAQFRAFQGLREELAATRVELEDRRVIDRAKSALMEQHGLSEKDAYRCMREQAMRDRKRIGEVARLVLDNPRTHRGRADGL